MDPIKEYPTKNGSVYIDNNGDWTIKNNGKEIHIGKYALLVDGDNLKGEFMAKNYDKGMEFAESDVEKILGELKGQDSDALSLEKRVVFFKAANQDGMYILKYSSPIKDSDSEDSGLGDIGFADE